MDDLTLINNTSVYRNPAPQSPLQGPNVMQPAAVYSKIMLRTIELAESDYVFDGLAVERTMPSNNGSNEIVFKRMLSLAAHTQPLVEGIPPASDQGRMVAIKASTKSYGRVMKFTDKVNWAVVDPLISEYTRQLSLKIPETKDILAQQALLAECQTFYACEKEHETGTDHDMLVPKANGEVTHIKYMTPDCAPTIDEFRKIVLSMEAAKVRPYQGSNFLALISSAVMFDLITDKRVKEFMKYQGTGAAYSNDMVIDLFSLAFKKAKTIKTDNTFIDGDGNVQYIYHAPNFAIVKTASAANRYDQFYTDAAATTNALTETEYTGAVNILSTVPVSEWSATTVLTVVPVKKTTAGAYELNKILYTKKAAIDAATGGAYDVLNIHCSFVLGEDCLYRIGVEGHTAPQFIKKELGSAGTEDPLNQRQSIGWKIDSLGYKVPNPDAVVLYMSCPTQYRVNINARPDVKNQFTDYFYGYVGTLDGKYYYPEQVMQTVVNGVVKYYVRGTTTEVTPVKMTKLVQPINGGRIDAEGKKPVQVGTVPAAQYCLASNHAIRFTAGQVEKSGNKYYIKGLTSTAAAEVIALPATYDVTVPTADGTGTETRTAIDEGTPLSNLTGDPRIDG